VAIRLRRYFGKTGTFGRDEYRNKGVRLFRQSPLIFRLTKMAHTSRNRAPESNQVHYRAPSLAADASRRRS
jgi:hypothetical protein